jgi:two-component system KDP operon response regulator KdpE
MKSGCGMENNSGLRVLVADDEKTIRRFLKATLKSKGMTVIEASDGGQAVDAALNSHPDAVILDLGLPDMDGIEVVKKIRERSAVPIIILSVREDESDKIAALDAGADDYLTKPFNAGELLARIRTIMRRLKPGEEGPVYKSGELEVDISRHSVGVKGKAVRLTPVEFDILKMLVIDGGKVLTHKRILKEIWGKNEDPEDAMHLLRVTISNLRNKIEPDPDRPEHIITEPGVGYRLFEE